jgi:drug/metabolite transporter (DMT)-like permease
VISRRAPVLTVTLLSQGVGFVGLLVAFAVVHEISWRSFGFGLAAGVGGASGLALFYWALSIGTMSIVAPIAACSAIVPFSLALASGERPSALAFAGAALAIVGIVVASLEERRTRVPAQARAIVIAVAAAVTIGVFLYFLGRGGDAGSAFSTLLGSRIVSFVLLASAAVYARTALALSRPTLLQVALVGAGDLTANALFALAADRGLLAIVSVLGSVYPIATVLLAHVVLGERITGVQRLGVLCAFAGVAFVSAG